MKREPISYDGIKKDNVGGDFVSGKIYGYSGR